MNNTPTTEKMAIQKRIAILEQVKERASEKGDYNFFSKISQDIRELQKELQEYETTRKDASSGD
jgi:hypothetical protein